MKHTPTPEDKTAELLQDSWEKYFGAFGVTVHGTLSQLRAMLCLGGGKDVVRAVNAYERDHEVIKGLLEAMRLIADRDKGQAGFEAKAAIRKASEAINA